MGWNFRLIKNICLGLAYANQNLKNQGIKPLFDNIME
jgi:hypothetical protein